MFFNQYHCFYTIMYCKFIWRIRWYLFNLLSYTSTKVSYFINKKELKHEINRYNKRNGNFLKNHRVSKYYKCELLPFAKIILWLPCLRPNCNSSAFTFHHLSDRVENIKCFITIQIQFYSQTHNKSQSFESRTNTNGLCSTSSLTWVNINSKYFSCMLFSEYVYGITQSEILYTKTLLLSIPLKCEILKNVRTSIYNQII